MLPVYSSHKTRRGGPAPTNLWSSSFKVSAARARAGSMMRVYSSRRVSTPAAGLCLLHSSFFLHPSSPLPRMRFTSVTQVSESRSVTAGSLLLGFSIAYSTRSQLNTWFVHLLAQAVENLCSDPAMATVCCTAAVGTTSPTTARVAPIPATAMPRTTTAASSGFVV
jgi:hypothetical protein